MYIALFLIITIIALATLIRIQPSDRRTIFEPGVLIVSFFSLCYLLPTLAIVIGSDILPEINMASVESIAQYGFLFVTSFLLFYILVGKSIPVSTIPSRVRRARLSPKSCLILIVAIFAAVKLTLATYGVGKAADYTEQYAIRASMPMAVSQVLNILGGLQFMLVCLLLSSTLGPTAKKQSVRFLWAAAAVFFVDMLLTQARGNFVTFALLFAGTYTFYNRSIGLHKEVFIATIFMAVMGGFAIFRTGELGDASIGLISVLLPSEFISVYRNAFHLVTIADTSDFVQPPGNSYLQALISFIPRQLNPEKWDVNVWYVSEYFPAFFAAGGGACFWDYS